MKIGILVTNTDESAFAQARPKDGEKFRALLQPLRPDWTFTAFSVKDGIFPVNVDAFDGYVITGSPASANAAEAWIEQFMVFICALDDKRIPTIGICFGHQIIARALGGQVGKNPGGWGFGVAQTTYDEAEAWMLSAKKTISLYAAHVEQVLKVPASARVIGGSEFCPIGSYNIGQHIFTTEYHPEITKEFVTDLSFEFENYVGSGIAVRAREQFKSRTDGGLFALWMINFFELPR